MKSIHLFLFALILLFVSGCNSGESTTEGDQQNDASEVSIMPSEPLQSDSQHDLVLSDRVVRITSTGNSATFQLYETTAASELYEQLPLELDLTNFREAQWMFYPPQKLNVTATEAYHDGKKGELSYYEPWGDVFMLYEDFYAGDEMHRLGVGLTGIDDIEEMSGTVTIEKEELERDSSDAVSNREMIIQANGNTIIFELNDSPGAQTLYEQLPLTIEVENYGRNEKIFYPPNELTVEGTPLVSDQTGTLAYYEPWGDVVMFYDSFSPANGLYELGHIVSGEEFISEMSGMIQIRKNSD